jgi:hypothetical protein
MAHFSRGKITGIRTWIAPQSSLGAVVMIVKLLQRAGYPIPPAFP